MTATRNGLDFLRDGSGIYGLGFREKFERRGFGPSPIATSPLIIRPDKFKGHRSRQLALQQVPAKLPRLFRCSVERGLANDLHRLLFEQSARLDGLDPECGAEGLRTDERLRKKFYGCRAKATRITNALIRQLLAEAGDQRAIRQARRFPLNERQYIYYLATRSDRLSQVCDSFPLLAITVAYDLVDRKDEIRSLARDAIGAVTAGRSLRHVAGMMGIPFVMRSVPPLAVNQAAGFCDLFRRNPHLIHAMPSGGRAARSWFAVLRAASNTSPDFAEWVAKKFDIVPPYAGAEAEIASIGDWVKAGYDKCVQAAIEDLAEKLKNELPAEYVREKLNGSHRLLANHTAAVGLVTRPFKPSMSLRTVRRLSDDWHEAVIDQRFSGDTKPLPKAWAPKSEIGGYEIRPLETPLDLYLEGRAMHNCVATYDATVRHGACYLFSMKKDDEPVATIAIGIGSDGFHLSQCAGPCNQPLDKKTKQIIRRWVRSTKFVREEPHDSRSWEPAGDDFEIPF